MLVIVTVIICGILLGKILKHRVSAVLPHIITVLIWVLLFILGIEAGSNEQIVGEFTNLGAEAFIITLGGLAGSVLCAWLLWRFIERNRKEDER